MNKQKVRAIINYWRKTAEHDYETMLTLFRNGRYSDSLFYGHIVLEKILKGLVVKNIKKHAPYIHDLVRLQGLTELHLPRKTLYFLNRINDFNIRGRYPEERLQFYKKCTKEFTKSYLDKIIKLYKELCQKLKQGE